MSLKMVFSVESFATRPTLKRPFTSVYPHMDGQRRRTRETLTTQCTHKLLLRIWNQTEQNVTTYNTMPNFQIIFWNRSAGYVFCNNHKSVNKCHIYTGESRKNKHIYCMCFNTTCFTLPHVLIIYRMCYYTSLLLYRMFHYTTCITIPHVLLYSICSNTACFIIPHVLLYRMC